MTAKRPGANPGGQGDREVQRISDPRSMRAIAHPTRVALLEALAREGPLTATRAAELLDDSPGNMSWHLHTLAKYGYVEEAGQGRGRSRPWRVVSVTRDFDTTAVAPEGSAAGEALEAAFQDRNYQRLRSWWSTRRSYSAKWRKSAYSIDALTYLTVDELAQLGEEIAALTLRYRDRTRDRAQRPPGSMPVQLVAYGHPLPPTPSGN
jgi:DNA-binding transcriptional ArsR family regulator